MLAPAWAQSTSSKKVTVQLIVTNAQGSVVAKMTPGGQVTYTAAYRPYGKQAKGASQTGPDYTGHMYDPNSGLVYMQQRYYNPTVGRFISPDPVAPVPGGLFNFNRYTYANDNPIRFTDPNGKYPCAQCLYFPPSLSGESYKQQARIIQGASGKALKMTAVAAVAAVSIAASGGTDTPEVAAAATDAAVDAAGDAGAEATTEVDGAMTSEAGGDASATTGDLARTNKIHHIFSQSRHNLTGVAKTLGGKNKAFKAIEEATGKSVDTSKAGRFETTVKVGGEQVTVRGSVADGKVKIGTAFVKKELGNGY